VLALGKETKVAIEVSIRWIADRFCDNKFDHPKLQEADDQCKMAMKGSKGQIAEPLGKPDLNRQQDFHAKFWETINWILKGILRSSPPDIAAPILELKFSLSL